MLTPFHLKSGNLSPKKQQVEQDLKIVIRAKNKVKYFSIGTKKSIFDMDCSTKQTIATFVDKQIPKLLKESLET